MTEEQKEKYANFLDKISEILGLNKPVDILRLCAVTDKYLRPIEKHIAELEEESAELKTQIDKMKCCLKCEHWYYYKSFCDKDNSYHSEGQSCEHFTLRR